MRRQPMLAWHVLCLACLLLLVQLIFVIHPDREIGYHLKTSGIVGLWLAIGLMCNWLQNRAGDAPWSHHLWMAADAALLTALLSQLDPSPGVLLGSYFSLVCISGLFFQTRLVAFTTAIVVTASLALFVLRPEEADPLHYVLLVETSLVMTGFVIGYQVWRMNVLREYYDDRRRIG
jgi:hypothetical protein